MTQEVRWKKIELPGVDRYEISETGVIRNIKTGKRKKIYTDAGGFRDVLLHTSGRSRKYDVDVLLQKTFGIQILNKIEHKETYKHPEEYSRNEDDYGLGFQSIHWKELKEQIKKVKHLFKL